MATRARLLNAIAVITAVLGSLDGMLQKPLNRDDLILKLALLLREQVERGLVHG